MKCNFCGEQMPEDVSICPSCGWDQTRDLEERCEADTEAMIDIVLPENQVADDIEQTEQMLEPEVRKMRRSAVISGCLAVLAVLAAVLFFGLRGGLFQPNVDPTQSTPATQPTQPAQGTIPADGNPNDATCKGSYTVEDAQAVADADVVVATLGDAQLTNGQLQIFYQMEIMDFLNNYGYYLSYFGLDYTKPLDQQVCVMMEGYTWQQFFLECALDTWKQCQILSLEADKHQFQMDSAYQQELDALETNLTLSAIQSGFDTADAYLQAQCGVNTIMADYKNYVAVNWNGYLYFAQLSSEIEVPSDEALEDYFLANKEMLEAQGIKQDGSYLVNVRHILVLPEGATLDNIRTSTFSDEAWEAGRVQAQTILDEWMAGEATEESFAALANAYSVDPGSNTQGGLYTDVAVGQMVQAFEAWCFDSARQKGDVGLVKTELGYHVMFFSERSKDLWLIDTLEAYKSQKEVEIIEGLMEQYEMIVEFSQIALAYVPLA